MPPTADDAVRYETHIKPLFRADDRDAMDFAFDLWDYDDVKTNADDILERLRDGSMPCDRPWPDDQVDLFQRWMDADAPR